MTDERIQLLSRMPIFGGLEPASLEILLDQADSSRCGSGEYFVREGEPGASVFVLESGRVTVLKRDRDHEQELRNLGPGDCFGEVALLDLGPRSASVRAETAASALEFTARDLLVVGSRDMEQLTLIYMNLARELGRRLRSADERLFGSQRAGSRPAAGYTFHVH